MDAPTVGTRSGRLARLLASRRNRILLAAGLFCLIVRIALPEVLRPILVTRADEALAGRIELEDLDLALLRGGVTLHGFSVHSDERPSEAPALFEAERLSTNISWLALLGRTLEIEELSIESFAVRLDRFDDGLLLPKPIAADEPESPPPAEPEAEASIMETWSLAADLIALRDGQIELLDHTVKGEPERFELGIEDFSARELAIRSTQTDDEPGRIAIEAQLDQGAVSLAAWIKQYEAGLDVRSTLSLVDIPIDKLRAYLTTFGWDELAGQLDASIEHHYEPGGLHEVRGKASLKDLRVGVPRFEEPALAWENLEIVLDRIDLVKRHAAIASIQSSGARVLVDPKSESPLALLTPPSDNSALGDADEDPPKAEPASAADPLAAEAEAETAESESAWSWRVEKTNVADLVVDLRGAEAPLLLRAQAELASLSSEPGVRAPLTLSVAAEQGRLDLEGELAPSPFTFEGKLRIADLALPPLAAQVEAPALDWLRQGTLRADLTLSLGDDLRASGLIGLAGLDLGEAQTAKQFRVEWKDLELAIQQLELNDLAGRSASGKPRALDVQLARVQLSEPRFVLTREATGLVLPPLSPASQDGAPSENAAPAEPAPAEPAGSRTPLAIRVVIADARIAGARGQLADRAVVPYYRGRIEALEVHATGVRWPENEVDALDLKMEGLRGATLAVTGSIHPGQSQLEGKLVELPLDQFNPYLTSTGYSLRQGALSLDSTARFQSEQFKTESKLVLAALDVGGADGDAAFQENFGIPLSLALGLLKDLDGKIQLAIPVAGKRDKVNVGFGRIVTQALRKALVGALASPLKLFGAVAGDGKVKSLAPKPIAFPPGSSELSAEGAARAEELAGLLAASPGVALVLTGQGSDSDQRVLRERALLVQLEANRGVRALAALGEIATRRAVRDHLGRKLAGETPRALSDEEAHWLETAISQSVPPTRALEELAEDRAARVRDLLASEHGIAATRLVVESPRVDPPAAEPGVGIALAALDASKPSAP